jgi:hypothetical protein
MKRPVVGIPQGATWEYSRICDLVVLDPPGPQTALPLSDFGRWYLEQSRLLRLGSHFWACVETQCSATVAQQLRLLGANDSDVLALEPDQIRLQAYHAIASGARGLLFRSRSRLDSSDRLTSLRAKALQRVNQELQLIEPWAATGKHEGEYTASDPSVRVSLLTIERSRLLIAIRRLADQQFVAGPFADHPLVLDVPGIPETDEVYRVGEDGLERIAQRRGTGVRMLLEHPGLVSTVVLTQDQLVVNFLARQTAALRRYQDQLLGEIAAQMYAAVVETRQALLESMSADGASPITVNSASLDLARNELQQFQQLIEGGGHERAYEFLERGRRELAMTRYQDWKQASRVFPSAVTSPLCLSFFTLPTHFKLGQRLQGAAWGPNSLAGGDFENLSLLQTSGWQNLTGSQEDVATGVELSLDAPHTGRTALRLQCWPRGDQPPELIESPPLKIISAPVPVRRGQLVRAHGWVRVPHELQGSMDGLLVYDSIAGRELAHRVRMTEGWQEFTLYRAVPRDGSCTLTFALAALGEVWLDDVTVHLIDMASSQALAPDEVELLPR